MATLGRYEILHTLANDGLVAVHAARPASRPDAAPVRLVTFRPAETLAEHPRSLIERTAFVDAFKRQQQLAQSSESWARVMEIARDGATSYAVVEHAPWSLQDLVIGRVPVPANTLRHLVRSIVQGLRATIAQDGHPHGALSPASVLIERDKPLNETEIRLTDPAPALTAESRDPHMDLRDLGLVILRLVDPQPTWTGVRWPIQSSPAWKRVGRSGEAWRELVNRLLDPNAEQRGTGMSLEDVEQSLPIEPRDLRKPIGITTAAVIVLLAGGFIYWRFFHVPALTVEQIGPARAALINLDHEYRRWFARFHDAVGTSGSDPFASLRQSGGETGSVRFLDERVVTVLRSAKSDNPNLSFKSGAYFDNQTAYGNISASAILSLEAEALQTNIDQAEFGRIELALTTINEVRTALEEWPLRKRLEDAASGFRERGWTGAATDAERLAEAALSPPNPAESDDDVEPRDVFESVQAVLQAAPALTQIEAILAARQRIEERAREIGLSVPQAFGEWLDDRGAGKAAISTLRDELASIEPTLREMETILTAEQGIYAWTIFDAEVGSTPAVLASADLAYFNDWVSVAKQYRAMTDDPRGQIELDPWIVNVTDSIGRIGNFTKTEADRLAAARDALANDVRALLNRSAIEKNRPEIESQVEAMAARMTQFQEEARLLRLSLERPPAEYLAELRGHTFASPALNRLWQARLDDSGLADRLAGQLETYGAFYQTMEAIRGAFTALSEERFAPPRPLPSATNGWQPARLDALVQRELEARRQTVGETLLLASSNNSTNAPDLTTPAVGDVLQREEASFSTWFEQLASFGDDMTAMERALNAGCLPDESIDAAVAPRIIRANWFDGQRSALAAQLQPAAEGILARLNEAEAMLIAPDLNAVMANLNPATPAQYASRWWSAWRRLGELPYESGRALAEDRQVLTALRDWLDSASLNESRRTTLRQRLAAEAPARWMRFARTLTAPTDFESAFAERQVFAVNDAALPDWLRWNLELSELREALRPLGDDRSQEDRAKAVLRQFLTDSQVAAGPATSRPVAATLREEVDIIANDREEKVDFTKIGPTTIHGDRWFFDADASDPQDGLRPPPRIVYRSRRLTRSDIELELEFILLDPREYPELDAPVYLATDEVSFDVFWQTVKESAIWDTVAPHLADATMDLDARPGPRVWLKSPQGNRLDRTDSWLLPDSARMRGSTDLTYPPGATPDQPTREHPMQYVSPQAAYFVARRLGCRLPTSLEMKVAGRKVFGAGGMTAVVDQIRKGSAPTPAPNLRDHTFTAQAEWAQRTYEELLGRPTPFTPEAGAFDADPNDLRAYSFNDGTLWFHPVGTADNRQIRHLLGNVAEWVYEEPADIIGDEPLAVPPPVEIVQRLVGENLGIMGGSALSSPDLRPDEKQPIDLATFLMNHRKGFADVGFRLALVPRGRFTTIARYVLLKSDQAYLTAPGMEGGSP